MTHTIKSWIECPKFAGAKTGLLDIANKTGCDLEFYDEDRGWFSSTYFYKLTGTVDNLKLFGQYLQIAIKKYNDPD